MMSITPIRSVTALCVPEIPARTPVGVCPDFVFAGKLRSEAANHFLDKRHCWGYSAASLNQDIIWPSINKLGESPVLVLHLFLRFIKSNDSFLRHPKSQMTRDLES
jgi:hypothetical protein